MWLCTLLFWGFALGGCVDVRNFEGTWSGPIVSEEAVRQGFGLDATVELLTLTHVDLQAVTATLTLNDGKFKETRLTRVLKFSNDALASLTFDGSPLRSYFLFAPLETDTAGPPAMVVLSLFGDEHIEVRVFRTNDLFGVFYLHRKE